MTIFHQCFQPPPPTHTRDSQNRITIFFCFFSRFLYLVVMTRTKAQALLSCLIWRTPASDRCSGDPVVYVPPSTRAPIVDYLPCTRVRLSSLLPRLLWFCARPSLSAEEQSWRFRMFGSLAVFRNTFFMNVMALNTHGSIIHRYSPRVLIVCVFPYMTRGFFPVYRVRNIHCCGD